MAGAWRWPTSRRAVAEHAKQCDDEVIAPRGVERCDAIPYGDEDGQNAGIDASNQHVGLSEQQRARTGWLCERGEVAGDAPQIIRGARSLELDARGQRGNGMRFKPKEPVAPAGKASARHCGAAKRIENVSPLRQLQRL